MPAPHNKVVSLDLTWTSSEILGTQNDGECSSEAGLALHTRNSTCLLAIINFN